MERLKIRLNQISTHAPRTGSDRKDMPSKSTTGRFQPTLPARGATYFCSKAVRTTSFQPTLPARGATTTGITRCCAGTYFNPRSPHGERLEETLNSLRATKISTHAPRTGSDQGNGKNCDLSFDFNPRSPHGERQRKVTILSIRIIGFAQKVYHKTVLLRISLAENAVILPEKPRNPVRTSLQKAGGLRFARAIRAAHPYSISSPSGA